MTAPHHTTHKTQLFHRNTAWMLAAAIAVSLGTAAVAQNVDSAAPTLAPPVDTAPAADSLVPLVPAVPAPTPAPAPAATASTPAPAATTAPAIGEAVTQAFVGAVEADRVYVRSGPGVNYYELGQLNKGDLVQVVGQKQGWYQIVPPVGTYTLIAKDFVETDFDGKSGAVKADYVNVRAGSVLHPTSDYAVLSVVRKGTKLTIVGSTDKYYQIVPPARTYVYVKPDFVRQAPVGTEYRAASLSLPKGVVGPNVPEAPAPTAEAPTTTQPVVATTQETGTPQTPEGPAVTTTQPREVVVAPQPSTMYDRDLYGRFSELNNTAQAEIQKPLRERKWDVLLQAFETLSQQPKAPPSVKEGSLARIEMIKKDLAIQKMAADVNAVSAATEEQRKALQQQWQETEAKIREMELHGPMLAEGRLQTSTALQAKYVLVNPETGRVVAYVDPAADIDLSKLLGQYLGVRGSFEQAAGSPIKVIKVKNATIMPAPKPTPAPAAPAGK